MSDDELQDGEERHDDDAPLNISDDDLPEDEMPPLEETEDGVYVNGSDNEDEDELDIDEAFIEESY